MQATANAQQSPSTLPRTPAEVEIRSRVIAVVADTYAYTPEDLEKVIQEKGDFRVKSVPAHSILAALEGAFGRSLPSPAKLQPKQYASVGAIVELVSSVILKAQA